MKVKLKLRAAGLALMLLIFAVSVFLFIAEDMGSRRVLYFEAMDDSGLYMEIRRIMRYSPHQGREVHVRQFVQELLLGPAGNGFQPLFAREARLESCFVQDDILFINLSREALFPGESTSSLQDGVELMAFNVEKNFPWIKSVEIYIDGNKAYGSVV